MPSYEERVSRAEYLDRLTARFSYAVMALTALLFAFHAVRYVARVVLP